MDVNGETRTSTEIAPQNDTKAENEGKLQHKFIVFSGNHPENIRAALLRRGNFFETNFQTIEAEKKLLEELNLIWRPVQYPVKILQKIEKVNIQRKYVNPLIFNHIDGLKKMTTKPGLIKCLKKFYASHPAAIEAKYHHFDSTPTSFIIESNNENEEYFALITRYQELSQRIYARERLPPKHCLQNIWLVKPANMNQGKGIEIFRNLRDIKKFIWQKPAKTQWVVQKYIERPLLYNGRKFDIRVWALVTDRGELFLYKHGYIRTSSDKYTLETTENYVHLTNNCLQQYGTKYGLHEEGNTLSFNALSEYLTDKYKKEVMDEDIVPRIKDLVTDTILSVKEEIIAQGKKKGHNFELLGYDFMIDEDLRVWLIEVNTNPYLGIPNAYIEGLLPKMLDDMFELVLDNVYPTLSCNRNDSPNDFELLYCEKDSMHFSLPLNFRRSYSKDLLYPKELSKKTAKKPRGKLQNKSMIHKSQEELFCNKRRSPNSTSIEEPSSSRLHQQNKTKVKTVRIAYKRSLESLTKEILLKSSLPEFEEYFTKFVSTVKEYMATPKPEIGNSIINAANNMIHSKILLQITSANQKDLLDLLETAFNLSVPLQENIRHALADVINALVSDVESKRLLYHKIAVHTILNALLDISLLNPEENALGTIPLMVFTKLLTMNQEKSHIPGENLKNEKIRVKLLQYGAIPVLFCIATNAKCKELSNLAVQHICSLYAMPEIEFSLKMLEKLERGTNAQKVEKVRTIPWAIWIEKVPKLREKVGTYPMLWQDKEPILSEKCKRMIQVNEVATSIKEFLTEYRKLNSIEELPIIKCSPLKEPLVLFKRTQHQTRTESSKNSRLPIIMLKQQILKKKQSEDLRSETIVSKVRSIPRTKRATECKSGAITHRPEKSEKVRTMLGDYSASQITNRANRKLAVNLPKDFQTFDFSKSICKPVDKEAKANASMISMGNNCLTIPEFAEHTSHALGTPLLNQRRYANALRICAIYGKKGMCVSNLAKHRKAIS